MNECIYCNCELNEDEIDVCSICEDMMVVKRYNDHREFVNKQQYNYEVENDLRKP